MAGARIHDDRVDKIHLITKGGMRKHPAFSCVMILQITISCVFIPLFILQKLLLLILQGIKLMVSAPLLQQLLVIALLHNDALVQ